MVYLGYLYDTAYSRISTSSENEGASMMCCPICSTLCSGWQQWNAEDWWIAFIRSAVQTVKYDAVYGPSIQACSLAPTPLKPSRNNIATATEPYLAAEPFCHDDVIKWKHFPRHWPFVRGIPLTKASDAEVCVCTNGWVNNQDAGDLRHHRVPYDVTVMVSWSANLHRILFGQKCFIAIWRNQQLSQWWRHRIETFSALLALCAGNSPVADEFPAQSPVTRSFDVFFHLRMNKRLSKQPWGWWLETPSGPLWRHCNAMRVYVKNDISHFFSTRILLTVLYCDCVVRHSLRRCLGLLE